MEVRVKLLRLEKLKLATKFDEESNMLKTNVSFEVEGKVESLVRVMNLSQQRQPIYAVIGCEQATFDLKVARVEDKAKSEKPSEKPGEGNGQGSDDQAQQAVAKAKDKSKDKSFDEANPGSAKVAMK